MVSFHVVLRDGAVVLDSLLCQEVCCVGLLKQGIADVLFVGEDFLNGAGVPFCFACAGKDAISLKASGDLVHAEPLQVFSVDTLDNLCLVRIDDQMSVRVLGVSEESVVVDLHLSLLVAVLQAELHVLRKALAFLLGKRGHDRQ